jgi:hypothetical protein
MKQTILVTAVALSLAACNGPKETSQSQTSSTTPATTNNPTSSSATATSETTAPGMAPQDQTQKQDENMFRLIVSFISIGEGIDPEGKMKLDRTVNPWSERKGKPIQAEQYSWGREGEVDFCYRLTELTPEEQRLFVSQVTEVFKDNKLVYITENQSCRHKR